MATAGIAHVLSVSGLHLTLVAGGVFAALRLLLSGWEGLATRVSVKRIAAVGGIVAALFYFAISGGNVAAFRSTLMIVLVFGAVLFGRRALTMRNVAIAAVVVIATDPASVFRPSFQLSFAAVVALVGAYENFRSERLKDASFARPCLGIRQGHRRDEPGGGRSDAAVLGLSLPADLAARRGRQSAEPAAGRLRDDAGGTAGRCWPCRSGSRGRSSRRWDGRSTG